MSKAIYQNILNTQRKTPRKVHEKTPNNFLLCFSSSFHVYFYATTDKNINDTKLYLKMNTLQQMNTYWLVYSCFN